LTEASVPDPRSSGEIRRLIRGVIDDVLRSTPRETYKRLREL
jgi:hypothetical protein